jgi:hypothetical protein
VQYACVRVCTPLCLWPSGRLSRQHFLPCAAKHTAAEINAKIAAAMTNKGGGKAGLADRKGGAAGHAKFQ